MKAKTHNFILKTITCVMGIICPLSAMAADSDSWLPLILFVISGLWLIAFIRINEDVLV